MKSFANRGKAFEKMIVVSNKQYAMKRWAAVEKIEPPFKTLGYHRQYAYGYYESTGFVDFVGIANGRSLCFEAKSTNERTRFPLKSIKDFQYKILKDWYQQGSISFVLIEFEKRQVVFLLKFSQLQKWWEAMQAGGRKSIPFEWFHFNCQRVMNDRGIPLDYLQALNIQ